jgi:saccharopine dehydrogenase (NAD+, L-lysine-forming)
MTCTWMLYGAYGYTGQLVLERALELGERPILAGRDAARVEALAAAHGLAHRVVSLDDPSALREALVDIDVVAHCAGPFAATAEPMADACIASGADYLDISGEIIALEALFARDAAARAAGVTLVPGAGFDVVPSDCLAAQVAARLPGATRLELAFESGGGVSRGTARAAIEGSTSMSLCRVDGALVDAPRERRVQQVELGGRAARGTAVSWGDVSTAWRSTGIPDITVYVVVPRAVAEAARALSTVAGVPLLGVATRRALTAATRWLPNPSPERREQTGSRLWARVTADDGRSVVGEMTTPNSYSLTADAVVAAVQRLASGDVPSGVHPPSRAFGLTFAEQLAGVTVDLPA